jgi:hypothetical protein
MGRTRPGTQQKVAEWRPCKPVGPQYRVDLERPTVGEPLRLPPRPRLRQP